MPPPLPAARHPKTTAPTPGLTQSGVSDLRTLLAPDANKTAIATACRLYGLPFDEGLRTARARLAIHFMGGNQPNGQPQWLVDLSEFFLNYKVMTVMNSWAALYFGDRWVDKPSRVSILEHVLTLILADHEDDTTQPRAAHEAALIGTARPTAAHEPPFIVTDRFARLLHPQLHQGTPLGAKKTKGANKWIADEFIAPALADFGVTEEDKAYQGPARRLGQAFRSAWIRSGKIWRVLQTLDPAIKINRVLGRGRTATLMPWGIIIGSPDVALPIDLLASFFISADVCQASFVSRGRHRKVPRMAAQTPGALDRAHQESEGNHHAGSAQPTPTAPSPSRPPSPPPPSPSTHGPASVANAGPSRAPTTLRRRRQTPAARGILGTLPPETTSSSRPRAPPTTPPVPAPTRHRPASQRRRARPHGSGDTDYAPESDEEDTSPVQRSTREARHRRKRRRQSPSEQDDPTNDAGSAGNEGITTATQKLGRGPSRAKPQTMADPSASEPRARHRATRPKGDCAKKQAAPSPDGSGDGSGDSDVEGGQGQAHPPKAVRGPGWNAGHEKQQARANAKADAFLRTQQARVILDNPNPNQEKRPNYGRSGKFGGRSEAEIKELLTGPRNARFREFVNNHSQGYAPDFPRGLRFEGDGGPPFNPDQYAGKPHPAVSDTLHVSITKEQRQALKRGGIH